MRRGVWKCLADQLAVSRLPAPQLGEDLTHDQLRAVVDPGRNVALIRVRGFEGFQLGSQQRGRHVLVNPGVDPLADGSGTAGEMDKRGIPRIGAKNQRNALRSPMTRSTMTTTAREIRMRMTDRAATAASAEFSTYLRT